MATSFASEKPTLPIPSDGVHDPFVSNTPVSHHRYSAFDEDLFAAGPGSSPRQAKRALEAHLAETERRLEEAGKLGTALVSQRKALTERLQEVDKLQSAGDLSPELRQKLVDIEKEYNDLARESARAFLPKSRVPSNETSSGSPYAPDSAGPTTSGSTKSSRHRSISPSKFESKLESQATASPTKLTVPNRKVRNQPTNRVHDIEFAAEISTSLIAQVRNLQSMLAERDEELKDANFDKSNLEIETEGLQQRVKTLDESENRYKEENWNLETRIQEQAAQQKEAADREKKLTQNVNTLKAEKSAVQRDLDEVRVTHARLIDQHTAAVKQHDIELGTAKRNILIADGERAAMQRRIDDLTSQNHELARAFSMTRSRAVEREPASGMSDEDFETGPDNITPEDSPPQSPMKGTPRHAMLETETMKSSLQHAQRTIQSQRSLLHREKTEKLEMRRIIQDLRDDLEKARAEQPVAPVAPRRTRKPETREFKKPPRLLGGHRPSRQEVVQDDPDPDWEDQSVIDTSPRTAKAASKAGSEAGSLSPTSVRHSAGRPGPKDSGEHFDTANEATESAFETAHDRATETEDFQTGNEEFSGSGSEETETETETDNRGFGRMRKPPSLPAALAQAGNRDSFHSTASTSSDEDDFAELRRSPTATISSQRSGRVRINRGTFTPFTRSRQVSEDANMHGSPASFVSHDAETHEGQSLFAELQDFQGSDDDSIGPISPGRRSLRSVTPGSIRRPFSPPPAVPPLPKALMVDSGVMTEPMQFLAVPPGAGYLPVVHTGVMTDSEEDQLSVSEVSTVQRDRSVSGESTAASESQRTASRLSVNGQGFNVSRPMSVYSDASAQYDPEIEQKLAQFPAPPTAQPILPPPPELGLSTICSEGVEPREEVIVPPAPPALSITPILKETVEPIAEPEVPPPDLTLSTIVAEDLVPLAEPEIPLPDLTLSTIIAEDLVPLAEPESPLPDLTLSTIVAEDLVPLAEPEPPAPTLTLTPIQTELVTPIAEPEVPAPILSLSDLNIEAVDPVPEPKVAPVVVAPPPPALSMSAIFEEAVEPIAEPEPEPKAEPVFAPVPEPVTSAPEVPAAPELRLSSILGEQIEPIAEEAPELSLSPVLGEQVEPVAEQAPELSLSSVLGEQIEPVVEKSPELGLSPIAAQSFEPVSEPKEEPTPPSLTFIPLHIEHCEPREEQVEIPEPTPLVYSSIATENVEPVPEPEASVPALALSPIVTEDSKPVMEPLPTPPALDFSHIAAEAVEPVNPAVTKLQVPSFGFSTIESIETEPISPRSPKRDGFILPRDSSSFDEPVTPANKKSGPIMTRYSDNGSSPTIAEDETRQSPGDVLESDTPESQRPFREISTNSNARSAHETSIPTADQGAQTALTAEAIDDLFKVNKAHPGLAYQKSTSAGSVGSPGTIDTPGTVRIHRSHDSFDTPIRKGRTIDDAVFESSSILRPESAASNNALSPNAPPLPSNHRQAIEAARSGSAHGSQHMGPPLWPASALKARPTTPNQTRPMSPMSGHGTPTPRAGRAESAYGRADCHSPTKLTARSRQSSVSSFVSELDTRFNMRPSESGMVGFGPNTDPRMIQAITQTMIGEYLWKYTRKAGRGEFSENRHRRYFWVHPYTRTLYWSVRDPATAGRTELRAKSVPIEAVRVVTDDNPMPPGLHRKSMVIVSPGRTIKFTCTTGQRHETWFNALSYLLLRTSNDGHHDAEEMVENITREDIDEFNPQYGRRVPNGTRPGAAPSLSSYNSRTTRNESPAIDMSMNVPTLTPTPRKNLQAQKSAGTLSKISGYWKSSQVLGGTFTNRKGRAVSGYDGGIYEASEVHDSAEDVRGMIERQDRDADRLENVRACCDGKHDVGTLHHSGKKPRPQHTHSHPGPATAAPLASTQSRS